MPKYNKSIFIFRRDLRLNDNMGLINALKSSKTVIPIFIFTPEQLVRNPFKSNNCVQFMVESLEDLNKRLRKKKSKLFYFYGKVNSVIDKIVKRENVDAVFVNMDYTPYSIKRDKGIEKVCKKNDIDFVSVEDILLNPVKSILTSGGKVYSKFTPYFNVAKKKKIDKVMNNRHTNYYSGRNKIVSEYKKNIHKFYKENENITVYGGRSEAIKILTNINKFKKYNKERNILNIETTRLSAYNKFGCVSCREVYHVFKKKLGLRNDLIKQMYWRDFYYNLIYEHPEVLGSFKINRNFKKHYSRVPWIKYNNATTKNKKMWRAWCDGETGFPIIDAGMREMNETGFMHNRVRLNVASFLTRLMMWHWQDGEKYFAQNLVDYDPAQNNGNWQFCSGSGVDSQPYFRIFNPWLQSKKFDPDCEYIKKWIPELEDVDPKHIHRWNEYFEDYDVDYPEPILDYKKNKSSAIKKFARVVKN